MSTPTPHPYAEILRAIADGKRVQWNQSTGGWIDQGANDTLEEIAVNTYPVGRYRVATEMITIGGSQVPAPMRQAPPMNSKYYVLDPRDNSDAAYTWENDELDKNFLARGLVFSRQEDAILSTKAIQALLTGAST